MSFVDTSRGENFYGGFGGSSKCMVVEHNSGGFGCGCSVGMDEGS
jgi:hypothetical protein